MCRNIDIAIKKKGHASENYEIKEESGRPWNLLLVSFERTTFRDKLDRRHFANHLAAK